MPLKFTGWRRFRAELDEREIRQYLAAASRLGAEYMRDQIENGPKTGVIAYRKGGGRFRRSVNTAKAEFPARDSGRLLASVKAVSFNRKAFIAANTPYSGYLRKGTPKMQPRKMTIEALDYGMKQAAALRDGWIEWMRTRNR